jgi:hypothetical protein
VKERFLVVDDYGMGGIWAYLLAESAEQIGERYPTLNIVTETPDWLEGKEGDLPELDVNDDSDEWLAALRRERN